MTSNGNAGKTILAQLGGARFISMTGARDFLTNGRDLSFRLPKAARGIRKVTIELAPDDTYTVCFMKLSRKTWDSGIIYAASGIHSDRLRRVFENLTGLRTCL